MEDRVNGMNEGVVKGGVIMEGFGERKVVREEVRIWEVIVGEGVGWVEEEDV